MTAGIPAWALRVWLATHRKNTARYEMLQPTLSVDYILIININ
jgi:hypothetical protein